MTENSASAVTEQNIEEYQRDGVTCIRGAISMDWIEQLRPAADWAQANYGPYDGDISAGAEDQFYGGQFMWWREDTFRDFILDGAAAAIAQALTGAPEIRLFYDFLLTKEAGAGNPTPWHQDRLYYPLAGDGADNVCTTWIALDPVTLNSGAVEYVKGSHAWGRYIAPKSFNDDGRYGGLDIEALPDVANTRGDYDIVHYDLEPGDCVAHHVMGVHGAPENNADIRRRGLAIRWLPAEATFDPREETQYQLKAALGEGPDKFESGETVQGDNFPLFRF